jgi:hypothetical protein
MDPRASFREKGPGSPLLPDARLHRSDQVPSGGHVVQGERQHPRDGRDPLSAKVVLGFRPVHMGGSEHVDLQEVEELNQRRGEPSSLVRVDRLPGGRGAGHRRRCIHGPIAGGSPQLSEQSSHDPSILGALGGLLRACHRRTISNPSLDLRPRIVDAGIGLGGPSAGEPYPPFGAEGRIHGGQGRV